MLFSRALSSTRSFLTAALATGLLAGGLSGCAGLELTEIQSAYESPSNVAVYFRVSTRQGDPVGGLEAEQFAIYEDEALVSTFESKQTILNPELAASHYTLLLIDMSGSVTESDALSSIVEAARVFTGRVQSNQQVGIYAFDGEADLYQVSPFTESAASAEARAASLAGLQPNDPSTNLNGAVVQAIDTLDMALEQATTPLRFGTLVVFTDGTDRASRVSHEDMMAAVNDSEYEVFAIGLGGEIDEDLLGELGKDGTAMAADRAAVVEAFDEIAERIEKITKSYYLLSYCSPARAGEHEVTIEATATDEEEKEKTGKLETAFDAEGFEKGCDPNQEPSFDLEDTRTSEEREADAEGDGSAGDGKAGGNAKGGFRFGG